MPQESQPAHVGQLHQVHADAGRECDVAFDAEQAEAEDPPRLLRPEARERVDGQDVRQHGDARAEARPWRCR